MTSSHFQINSVVFICIDKAFIEVLSQGLEPAFVLFTGTMGKLSVENDNIYGELRQSESLHKGVSVTITLNLYKYQPPTTFNDGMSPQKTSDKDKLLHKSPKKINSPEKYKRNLVENKDEGKTIQILQSNDNVDSMIEVSENIQQRKVPPDVSMNTDLVSEDESFNRYSSQRQDSHSHGNVEGPHLETDELLKSESDISDYDNIEHVSQDNVEVSQDNEVEGALGNILESCPVQRETTV